MLELTRAEIRKLVSILEQSHEILEHDVDTDFLGSAVQSLAWEYPALFEEIDRDDYIPTEMKPEAFGRRRGECASKALIAACRKHGVPYDVRRLPCNGQYKLLVKIGRVVIIQEPMLDLDAEPRTSDFKRQLVAATGFVQQFEFDFEDMGRQIDWSGSVVAVLLHAAAGPKFTLEHRGLGAVMLGVPNESYSSWLMRFDLHRIAMYGFDAEADGVALPGTARAAAIQPDLVKATLKKKSKKTAGEAS